MQLKKIDWTFDQKGDIQSHYGKIDNILLFTIIKFKQDSLIFTSNVIPMVMKVDEKLENLSESILSEFPNTFSTDLDVDKFLLDRMKNEAEKTLEKFIEKISL